MAERPDDGDLDVRLEWPDDPSPTRRPPIQTPEAAADAPDRSADRRVRLRSGDGRSIAALRDELDSLRAEVSVLRDQVAVLRAQLEDGS